MDKIIEYILSFFQKKDGKRSYWGLILLLVVLFSINYSFNFSDQYVFEKKVENLKSIQNLLADPTLDQDVANYLRKKKQEIIIEINFDENEIYTIPKTEFKNFLDFRKFSLFHYISSSWLFILSAIWIPIALSRRNTIMPETFFMARLLTICLMTLTAYTLSIIYAGLMEYIPIFSYKHLWLNYIFNFFSIFIFLSMLFLFYSFINLNTKHAAPTAIRQKKTSIVQEIEKIQDDNLKKLLGEKNPLIWFNKIIEYNYKTNRTTTNVITTTVAILLLLFVFYSIGFTVFHLIRQFL